MLNLLRHRSLSILLALSLGIALLAGCNLYFDVDTVDQPWPIQEGDTDVDTNANQPDPDVGPDVGGEDADTGDCPPLSPSEIQAACDEANLQCGDFSVVDECGESVDVSCGECPDTDQCISGICQCIDESNTEFCAAQGDNFDVACGLISASGQCGEERTVDCGGCGDDAACIDHRCQACEVDCQDKCGMVPDGCGDFVDCSEDPDGVSCEAQDSCIDFACVNDDCTPIEDCDGIDASCGTVVDGCGGTIDCPTCSEGEECAPSNQCVCVSESDQELCDALELGCGEASTTDRCGFERNIDCGGCDGGEACNPVDSQCVDPDCVGRDLSSDFFNCGACGNTCASDETCDDGTCEAFACPEDQGAASGCAPVGPDPCSAEDQACQFTISTSTQPITVLFACQPTDNLGDVGVDEVCSSAARCQQGLHCIGWRSSGSVCSTPCRRRDHVGCDDDGTYCTDSFATDPERQMQEYGFCRPRCSPQDPESCPSNDRCTADPAFPDGTCQPHFRCMENGGSAGKSSGDSCDRANLNQDGCPFGLTCFPAGDDNADICVRPCQADSDCSSSESCQNGDAPWSEMRYCSAS